MINSKYRSYIAEKLKEIVAIDSPTGYTDKVQYYLCDELARLGYSPETLNKGGIFCSLGGDGHPLCLLAHADTLCAVVRNVKPDGHLSISNINFHVNSVETENVHIHTRFNGTYEGTIQVINPSVHVNPDVTCKRDMNTNMEVVLDEMVHTADDVKKLGIRSGDIIALEPRFRITEKGYVKSRFLDDKASVACLLAYAKYLKDEKIVLPRRVDILITVFEELGHGGACGIPKDTVDAISVDMGCVGNDLNCHEENVSICAKDNSGVYNPHIVNGLIKTAEKANLPYAVDIYPSYSSDVSVALRIGYNIRAGLIGPGVFASHGYERTHMDGLDATFQLICAYTAEDLFEKF